MVRDLHVDLRSASMEFYLVVRERSGAVDAFGNGFVGNSSRSRAMP
jgi:hypothetical protein